VKLLTHFLPFVETYNSSKKNHLNHQDTMPTFNKAFKEVGIVPISIICFMENRHKGTKNSERQFFWGKASNQNSFLLFNV